MRLLRMSKSDGWRENWSEGVSMENTNAETGTCYIRGAFDL